MRSPSRKKELEALLKAQARKQEAKTEPYIIIPAKEIPVSPPATEAQTVKSQDPPVPVVTVERDDQQSEPVQPEAEGGVLDMPESLAGLSCREILLLSEQGDLNPEESAWVRTRKNLGLVNDRPGPWSWMK